MNPTMADLEKYITKADPNKGTGFITHVAYLNLMGSLCIDDKEDTEDQLRESFRIFDKNGELMAHADALWITRTGAILHWCNDDLPPGALELLCAALRQDWPRIRTVSERLVRRAGVDELRVDWLLGDDHWGARVGELTYMGARGGKALLEYPYDVRH